MNLKEAIKILKLYLSNSYQGSEADLRSARKLGIEALERLQQHRKSHMDFTCRLLPGETEE